MIKNQKTILLIASIIIMGFLVASCDGTSKNPKYDKYYQGSDGVKVELVANSPPYNVYYYADGKREDNSFDIELKLHNQGASLSRGAVFVSGYDPAMIQIDGVEIIQSSFKDCVFDLTTIAQGNYNFYANCFGQEFSISKNEWEIKLNNIGETLSKFGVGWDTTKFLSDLDITFGDRSGDGGTHFGFNFNNPSVDVDYYNHGRLLIGYSSGLDIDFRNGVEYILPADDYNYPGGAQEYKTFNAHIKEWPLGLDETTQPFLITNCYLYTTFASPNVCIDPDPYSETRKVCTPGTVSFSSTQGAPVAITRIKQENTKTKALFEIQISNVGSGRIFDLGYFSGCNPYNTHRVTEKNLDVVYIGDIRIGKDRLDCNIQNRRIKLQNGRGTITCTYDYRYIASKSAYQTPLVVELWYGYSETTERSVKIKRVI